MKFFNRTARRIISTAKVLKYFEGEKNETNFNCILLYGYCRNSFEHHGKRAANAGSKRKTIAEQ
jgi:hypothetical protein